MIMPCGAENRFVAKTCSEEEPSRSQRDAEGLAARCSARRDRLRLACSSAPVGHGWAASVSERVSNSAASRIGRWRIDSEVSGSFGSRPHRNLRGGPGCTGPSAAREFDACLWSVIVERRAVPCE